MNPAWAQDQITILSNLSIEARDKALCAMNKTQWDALARVLKITLPLYGGDPPVLLSLAISRHKGLAYTVKFDAESVGAEGYTAAWQFAADLSRHHGLTLVCVYGTERDLSPCGMIAFRNGEEIARTGRVHR